MANYLLDSGLIIRLDRETADRAGEYIRIGRSKGGALSVPDSIIAATAVSHNLTLVTLNRAHFEGIAGLRIESLPESEYV